MCLLHFDDNDLLSPPHAVPGNLVEGVSTMTYCKLHWTACYYDQHQHSYSNSVGLVALTSSETPVQQNVGVEWCECVMV